ncbi:MAG: hypothetical protein J2P21_12980 [Chloracidobacterium sp.]|nr:hypothetical protein [Chloracidobacterium sp.]
MSNTSIHNERGATAGDQDANVAEDLHEPNDVNIPGVVKFLLWLSVAIAVAALLMWGLLRYFDARKAQEAPSPSPLATGGRLPPEPRLQGAPGSASSPAEDIRRFREREDQMLDSYGWIDRRNGLIRIPIEQAKRLILQRGLQATSPGASQGGATQGAENKR